MPNSCRTYTEITLDSTANGVFTVDSEWRITLFNRAADRITGIKAQQALGRHCRDVLISFPSAILRDEDGSVTGGVETFRDPTIVEELRKEIQGHHSFLDIISKNPEMQRLFWMFEQPDEKDTTVR